MEEKNEQEPQPRYSAQWNDLDWKMVLFWSASILGFILIAVIGSIFGDRGYFLAVFLGLVVIVLGNKPLYRFPCPRCGRPFFYSAAERGIRSAPTARTAD